MNSLELAFKEKLESMGISDTVVLDFNEKIEGESVIIVSLKQLKKIEPVLDGKIYRATIEGHLTGVWKVVDNSVTMAVKKRNDALEAIMREFLYTKVGGARVRLLKWDKDIRQDIVDDRRYYVLFDVTLEIELNMR
jgi:hypothetical protein